VARALKIQFESAGESQRVLLDGNDVSEAIRTPRASMNASRVSRHPQVRDALLDLQRRLGRQGEGAVLEGRDIGTVVFPDAELKIFLDADLEERARRRHAEMKEKVGGQEAVDATMPTEAQTVEEIRKRDEKDQNREVAPLKPADDARRLDTTEMSLNQVIDTVVALVEEKRAAR
jgi:cytidylate kinase